MNKKILARTTLKDKVSLLRQKFFLEMSDFEDSLDLDTSLENLHPLHATSQSLEFNGYGTILTPNRDEVDLEKIKNVFFEITKVENELRRRNGEAADEHRRTQADLNRAISKNESLEKELQLRDRHLAEVCNYRGRIVNENYGRKSPNLY